MKKLVVAIALAAGVTAVAFASFTNSRKKADPEKKVEKRECKHTCPFS